MTDVREIAFEMVKNTLEQKMFLADVKAKSQNLETKDNAFINMLVLTTFRHLTYIQKILRQFIKKKLNAAAQDSKYIFYLACCEILYLDTPDYAVLNSYVNLAKKKTDKYVSGFVNAVLRNICKQKTNLQQADDGSFFSNEFFHILKQDYGKKTIQKIQKASMQEPSLDISVKEDAPLWAQKLNAELLPSQTLRLKNNGKITELAGYQEGKWWVQDFSAALPVKCLSNLKNKKVLDMCAAPGGKTAQLCALGADVTALDISASRLQKLQENMNRLGFKPNVICQDALVYMDEFKGEPYDVVLLDAPCSATGTLRRHPELVHIKREKDVEKQAQLQEMFLDKVSPLIKKGGILLYCTCSIAKKEGEQQINAFLAKHTEFKLLPISSKELCESDTFKELITEEGFIRTLPFYMEKFGGMDAFFVARLKKEA